MNRLDILIEALRRFECFAVAHSGRKWNLADLQRAWTGLGYPSEYKPAVDGGFMRPLFGTKPRAL